MENKTSKRRAKGALLVDAPEVVEQKEHPKDCQCIDCSDKLFGSELKRRAKSNSNATDGMVDEVKQLLAESNTESDNQFEVKREKQSWFLPENILAIITGSGILISSIKLAYLSIAGGGILDIIGSSIVCFVLYYINSKIQVTYKG